MMLDLLGPRGPEDLQSLEEGLREVLETTSDADIARFSDRIATTGTDWGWKWTGS